MLISNLYGIAFDAVTVFGLDLDLLIKIGLWKAQFYIQLGYRASLFITLRIKMWVSNIKKHDL